MAERVIAARRSGTILLAAACWLGGCGGIDSAVSRTVGESVRLGPEWTLISLQPTLEAERTGQRIRMEIQEVRDWAKPEGSLVLRDGSEIRVEVELTASDGRQYRLVPVSIGRMIGFGLAQPEEGAGFAKGRRFTTLRVRASRQIVARKIDWYCWIGK